MANDNENISLTVNESQMSMTESKMMSEGFHSTPVTIEKANFNNECKFIFGLELIYSYSGLNCVLK